MREPGTAHEVGGATPIHGRRRVDLMVALVAYLGLAVAVWWGVWSTHPTSVTTCGCGDSALFLWFLDWPAVALAHGHNPFFSTAMFHPTGVNLLANTSETAIGLALAPVTWIFGPVATLNVALTLAPALSAWAMYWLVRRWVDWRPAAFAAGLLYGFSPFVLSSLADAHLMNGFLLVPPLVVGVLDELLVRQRTSAIRSGVGLGLLLVLQFFLGTELLVIMAISAVAGIGLLVAHAVVAHRDELARRWRHAVTGLAAGAALSIVLLAWPAWFALAGPAHLGDPVWPHSDFWLAGIRLSDLVMPHYAKQQLLFFFHTAGGYQGPAQPGAAYLGVGVVAISILGLVGLRSDRLLRFFGATTAALVLLALGSVRGWWLPWRLVGHLPVLDNVIPGRFVTIVLLCTGVMVAVVADHVRTWAARGTAKGTAVLRRFAASASAAAVLLAALVPVAAALAGNVPATVVPVVVPRWFAHRGAHLPGRQVVLSFPVPFALKESAMAWQAVENMPYDLAGGGGPEGWPSYSGAVRVGDETLASVSLDYKTSAAAVAGRLGAIRAALDEWGVTIVAVPDPVGLPPYDRVGNLDWVAAVVTAATGEAPVKQEGTWVWAGVPHAPPPVPLTAAALARCSGAGFAVGRPPPAVATCILGSASPAADPPT